MIFYDGYPDVPEISFDAKDVDEDDSRVRSEMFAFTDLRSIFQNGPLSPYMGSAPRSLITLSTLSQT